MKVGLVWKLWEYFSTELKFWFSSDHFGLFRLMNHFLDLSEDQYTLSHLLLFAHEHCTQTPLASID
jgi:hypothetical protein